MNNLENLSKQQLEELKIKIDSQITKIAKDEKDLIDRKNSVKNKTKINQLTTSDRMLAFGYSPRDKEVFLVDWVDVTDFSNGNDSDWNRFGFSHKTRPFGLSTGIKKEDAEKSYYLSSWTNQTGHDEFVTLFPNIWEEDIQVAYADKLSKLKEQYQEDKEILQDKLKAFIKQKDSINERIKQAIQL